MALPDLTGQKIKTTYERVVQTEGGIYYDGTGSLLDIASEASIDAVSASLASDVANNTANISQNTTDISNNLTLIGINTNQINVNKLDIDDLEVASASFASDILQNTGDIANNTSAILTNTSVILNNSSDITELNASASLALTTASYAGTTLTFTKGNGSTFDITGIGGGGGGTTDTGSLLKSASNEFAEITFEKGDGSTFLIDATPNKIEELVINKETFPIAKGTPVYVSGSTGNSSHVYLADADDPTKMPATYVLNETIASGNAGIALLAGLITSIDTSTFQAGEDVYVAGGGGYTNVKPTGSALIQKLGNVIKVDVNGSGVITGANRANDVPNISPNYLWMGNADSVATPTLSSSIVPTTSLTASYVEGANVDGAVGSATVAITAINATNADNVDIDSVAFNTEYGLVFRDGDSSNYQQLYADSQADTPSWNPSTNTLTTPNLSATDISGSIISASGEMYARTGDALGANYNTLMVDTTTGKFYHTGSYGGGGGGGTTTTISASMIYWAEENGNLNTGTDSGFQFSFGNGSTGEIGLPVPLRGAKAIGMIYNAEVIGTSATITLYKINNSTITSTGQSITLASPNYEGMTIFGTPVSIADDSSEVFAFRTTATSGTWTDVRVGVIIEYGIEATGLTGPQGPAGPSSGFPYTGSAEILISGSNEHFLVRSEAEGDLFEVNNNQSGSLFSVNDISGLPMFDVDSSGQLSAPVIATSAPTNTPQEGTFQFANIGGAYYLYAYINGGWRRTTLT